MTLLLNRFSCSVIVSTSVHTETGGLFKVKCPSPSVLVHHCVAPRYFRVCSAALTVRPSHQGSRDWSLISGSHVIVRRRKAAVLHTISTTRAVAGMLAPWGHNVTFPTNHKQQKQKHVVRLYHEVQQSELQGFWVFWDLLSLSWILTAVEIGLRQRGSSTWLLTIVTYWSGRIVY